MPVIAPTALGIIGSVGKMYGRAKANRELERLLAEAPKYKNRAGLAQTQLNARMPGAAQAERNVYGEQANILSRGQQAATSSSDILQQLAGVQSQTNQAISGINQAELSDYQRRYGNLTEAENADYIAAQNQFAQKAQIKGAIQENKQNTWGDVSSMGFGVANFASQGGFNKGGMGKEEVDPIKAAGNMSEMGLPTVAKSSAVGQVVPGGYHPQAMATASLNNNQLKYSESYNPNSPNYNPLFSSPNPYASMMKNMGLYDPFNQGMGYNYGMKR
jgi:hypothetical protein